MTVYVGPTNWWWLSSPEAPDACHVKGLARLCDVGTAARDGSRLICKNNGIAWFVAPNCVQVTSQWAGGQYNSTQVGDKCCICEWPALNTLMLNCGFNPCDWFVPSRNQLNNPGYVCRSRWDTFDATGYWSSTEVSATNACFQNFGSGFIFSTSKTFSTRVRPFRCVTY